MGNPSEQDVELTALVGAIGEVVESAIAREVPDETWEKVRELIADHMRAASEVLR
jgi:hypothetical protein